MDTTPAWLAAARATDTAARLAQETLERIADDRAAAIAEGVASLPRGGRQEVARLLGLHVSRIDAALARHKQHTVRPSSLPGPAEILSRLYAAELTAMDPLTEQQENALGWLIRSLVIDATWLGQGGELLAAEYAEAAQDGDVPEDLELVKTMAAWTPLRFLALVDKLTGRDG